MAMLKAGMAIAAVFIGAIAAFLGAVVSWSALSTGTISVGSGTGLSAVFETVAYAADPGRYLLLTAALGLAPLVLGVLAVRWGWRRINTASD